MLVSLPAVAEATFPGKNGKIAFTCCSTGQEEIYVVSPDGTGRTQLTHSSAREWFPRWSPDGTKIAFRSTRDNSAGELYVMNADGSDVMRLTDNDVAESVPSWLPDASRIGFARDGRIRTIRPDGTGEIVLAIGGNPVWSPDGKKIAFQQGTNIYVMDSDGRFATLLVAKSVFPAWSPDSQRVAYIRDGCIDNPTCELPDKALLRIDVDGTDERRLASVPSWDLLAWSPEGTEIAYSNFGGQITAIAPDGSGSRNITGGWDPDWQPIPVNSYPRPKDATPVDVSLVPAYAPCTSANRTHGPPLAFDSCNPPAKASDEATLGTPDANAKPVKGSGQVRYGAVGGDVRIDVEFYDVYDHSTLGDYTGELRLRTALRITDKQNTPHPGGPGAATVSDTTLGTSVPCAATADPTTGATCLLSTTFDALVPGAVPTGKRSVWALGRVQVDDGGADGDAETAVDNTLFMVQGVFVP